MAKPASDKVTIKKYANRRLYDTEGSSYITLDKLAVMIREGRDFEVVDAKTGEDITHQILTQIIVDEEARGTTMLPANFLRQLIGMYGGQSEGLVSPFLDSAMEAFKKNQETVAGAFSSTMFADLAKRNMAMFGGAAQAFTPKPAPAREPDGKAASEEIAQLKAELAALQAKVDKLR